MPKSYSMETKEKFIELRSKEYSFSQISEMIGVSRPTLIEWSREFENDIINMKSIEIEALQEKSRATWKHRLELNTKIRDQILEELENRDLSEVPTEKLFDQYLKYDQQIATLEKKGKLLIKEDATEQLDNMLESFSYKTIEV